jgi:hypothetical protein
MYMTLFSSSTLYAFIRVCVINSIPKGSTVPVFTIVVQNHQSNVTKVFVREYNDVLKLANIFTSLRSVLPNVTSFPT